MAVVYAAAAFICNAGMRTVIRRRPVARVMTFGAIRAKHSGVKCRIAMTGNTSRRQPGELPARMTALAG